MSTILSTSLAFPINRYTQREITDQLTDYWNPSSRLLKHIEQIHSHTGVQHRHLAMPFSRYRESNGFTARNHAFNEVALVLGKQAIEGALAQANLDAKQIDAIFFTTVTGLSVPSLDARLANRMSFRPDIKRNPIFGLGCVGGASILSRANDYVSAHPTHRALLLSVELCSLTIQQQDQSVANIISSGLFGDGAAAAIVVGDAVDTHARDTPFKIVDTASVFFPNTEHVMGWDIGENGFRIILSADVPNIAQGPVSNQVRTFLTGHNLTPQDIKWWIAHPGGPKVIDALAAGLDLAPHALQRSRDCLTEVGNLSSASVFWVLDKVMSSNEAAPGDVGLYMAMGPGFCAEMGLLRC